MNKKTILFALSLFSFVAVFPVNTSLLVIEQNGLESISSTTKIIESTILNTLFDCGQIVSNFPIIQQSEYEQIKDSVFQDSVLGRMDYFVEVTINYNLSNSKFPDGLLISNIDFIKYSIKSTLTGDVVFKSQNITPNNLKNDSNGIKSFANFIGTNINTNIMTLKSKKR